MSASSPTLPDDTTWVVVNDEEATGQQQRQASDSQRQQPSSTSQQPPAQTDDLTELDDILAALSSSHSSDDNTNSGSAAAAAAAAAAYAPQVLPPIQDSIMAYAPPSPSAPPWPTNDDMPPPSSPLGRPASPSVVPLGAQPSSLGLSNNLSAALSLFRNILWELSDEGEQEGFEECWRVDVETKDFIRRCQDEAFAPEAFKSAGMHLVVIKVVAAVDQRFRDLADFCLTSSGSGDWWEEMADGIVGKWESRTER